MDKKFGKYVSTREVGYRNSAGIGYLCVPVDVDRNTYVRDCLRKGVVSLMFDDGGVENEVMISKNALNESEFPLSSKELGSMVFWVNIPKFNKPVAVAILTKSNEIITLSENATVISRDTKFGGFEISGEGNLGGLVIRAYGKDGSKGRIDIIASNSENNAEINLTCKGNVNVDCSGSLNAKVGRELNISIQREDVVNTLKYSLGEGLTIEDENGNVFSTREQGFSIRNENADFKSILVGTFDALLQAIIQTPSGVGNFDANTIKKITDLKTQFNQLME